MRLLITHYWVFFVVFSPGSARCRHVQFFFKRGGVCPILCNSKYTVVNRQTSGFVGMFTAVEKLWEKNSHFYSLSFLLIPV